jgi:hypothetical protein
MKYPSFLLSAVIMFTSATAALAQDPQPPARDTTRAMTADTTAKDSTTAADTAQAPPQDSVRPIPQLAKHYFDPANGFTNGIWYWSRDSLMLEAPVTLGDLLERIPGVLTLRAGYYVQPEAATALGAVGNRLEIWLDGYILDPLFESSYDVTKLELANIESVRVERRMGMMRVHIETLMPADTRAYSLVEAAVGEPNANLFRGVFLVPRLFFGPLGLSIDRIDTDGLNRTEPADQFAGWAKWSYVRPGGSGVQVEFRRMSTDRDPSSPYVAKFLRDDLIVRGRLHLFSGLVAEVFGGKSSLGVDTVTTTADNDSIPRVDTENIQFGGRASFVSKVFWARGSFRLRDHEFLPSTQLDASAGGRFNMLSAAAEFTQTAWRGASSAAELTLRAEAGPFRGFRVFGESTTSERGVPFLAGVADTARKAVITRYEGLRAGAQVEWRGVVAAGALLKATTNFSTTLGLPFDQGRQLTFGADASGWEVMGRVPVPWIKGLFAQGTITDWYSGNVSLYMPTRIYRGGAELHTLPLKSGNLEVLGRLEVVHRGNMLVPNFEPPAPGEDPETEIALAPIQSIDAYLQIRIFAVRAFLRWEDLAARRVAEIAGRNLPGQRLFYGVKWQFWN